MTTEEPSSQPLLSLDTFVKRQTVVIDGVAYEMSRRQDLGAVDGARLRQASIRITGKMNEPGFGDDPDEVAELVAALNLSMSILLRGLPDEVLARLSDMQKIQIVESFLTAEGIARPALPEVADPPTGVKLSRASNASTAAATPRHG